MAIAIERRTNTPILDRVLTRLSRPRSEAIEIEEQKKADALRLRNAALNRIPETPDNFPFLKTPFQVDTHSLGGTSQIIVYTKNPAEMDVKVRVPASQAKERFISIGTGTLSIDPLGNLEATFLEQSRQPLPNRIMRREDYEIGRESTPVSVTHDEMVLISNSILNEGSIALSPVAESYVRAQSGQTT